MVPRKPIAVGHVEHVQGHVDHVQAVVVETVKLAVLLGLTRRPAPTSPAFLHSAAL